MPRAVDAPNFNHEAVLTFQYGCPVSSLALLTVVMRLLERNRPIRSSLASLFVVPFFDGGIRSLSTCKILLCFWKIVHHRQTAM